MKYFLIALLFLYSCSPKISSTKDTTTTTETTIREEQHQVHDSLQTSIQIDQLLDIINSASKDTIRDTIRVPYKVIEHRKNGINTSLRIERDSLNNLVLSLMARVDSTLKDQDTTTNTKTVSSEVITKSQCPYLPPILRGWLGHMVLICLAGFFGLPALVWVIWSLIKALKTKMPY